MYFIILEGPDVHIKSASHFNMLEKVDLLMQSVVESGTSAGWTPHHVNFSKGMHPGRFHRALLLRGSKPGVMHEGNHQKDNSTAARASDDVCRTQDSKGIGHEPSAIP